MRIYSILPAADVSYLDRELLDDDRRLRLLPAAAYASIERTHLQLWCHLQARFLLPTIELVDWLRARIGGRRAIEIGSGNGDLYHHLGIPGTDSYCQTRIPWIARQCALQKQPPTRPRADVLDLDALQAVRRFEPQVVIGSWCTERGDRGPTCTVGIDDRRLIASVETYIHIGNERTHGEKSALPTVRERLRFPWLVSRSSFPEEDVIYVWDSSP